MNWEVTIKKVRNGYLLTAPAQTADEDAMEMVIQDDLEDNEMTDKKTMQKVLEEIAEYFGFIHDKWDKNNLSVTWDSPGRKAYDE